MRLHNAETFSLRIRRVKRFGFTMLVGMIVLTMVTGLSVVWAKRTVMQRRQAVERHEATQAEWLATSAVERALSRLAADPAYKEETWQLAPSDLAGNASARIEIRISAGTLENSKQIEVLVDYPDDPLLRQRVRRIQQVLAPLPENPS